CEIPAEALTKQAPLYDRESQEPSYLKQTQKLSLANVPEPKDYQKILLQLLDSPSIASKESAYQQFTYAAKDEVAVGAGSDAAVIKVKGTKKALAISVDCNSRFCYLNPYQGAMMAVAEAARNVVCAGGRPLAITDGLNFGNPMKRENYWQFQKCIEGLSDACKALGTPVVSGNVSFYNENPKGAIDPTPMVGMVGLIEDARKRLTQDFKDKNDVIVLLGENREGLGGSEYLYQIHRQKKGNPQIELKEEKALQEACLEMIQSGILRSAHDCSEGGLAVCVAESCVTDANRLVGAVVELDAAKKPAMRLDDTLFGEAPSRIVVSVKEENLPKLEKIAKKHALPYSKLGKVGGTRFVVKQGRRELINLPVTELNQAWRNAIPSRLKND
ncbi:MAG: AIR synthase related protein, partial [Candidatus Omnitrophota bacterium]